MDASVARSEVPTAIFRENWTRRFEKREGAAWQTVSIGALRPVGAATEHYYAGRACRQADGGLTKR